MTGILMIILCYLGVGLYCAIRELPYTIVEFKKNYTSRWCKIRQVKYNLRIILTWPVDCMDWDNY